MTTDPIAAARALIAAHPDLLFRCGLCPDECNCHPHHDMSMSGGNILCYGCEDFDTAATPPDPIKLIATLADALEAERERAEKAETERDTAWNDAIEAAKGCVDDNHPFNIIDEMDLLKKGNSHNQQAERDQTLALIAAAYVVADAWLDKQYGIAPCVNDLSPNDAQDAFNKMLAEARLEGWRAGRDAATEPLTSLAAVLRKSENSYHQSQATAMLERVAAIRALPEPKEASHD